MNSKIHKLKKVLRCEIMCSKFSIFESEVQFRGMSTSIIGFILLYSSINNVLLTESAYNISCIGCFNFTSNDDGCIYCAECDPMLTPQCKSTCDMESVCNETILSDSSDSTKWWLIAGFSIGALCCLFVFVIVLYIYRITKDDHELAMMKISRKNSKQGDLVNAYSNSSRMGHHNLHNNYNNHENNKENHRKHEKQSSNLSPVIEPIDSNFDEDTMNLELDDDVNVHNIKITVNSPVDNSNNNDKPKMHRFDSV